jgi:hypothetical protein
MIRERELWTKYVEKREAEQRPKRRRAKKQSDGMMAAQIEAELDDLVNEAERQLKR